MGKYIRKRAGRAPAAELAQVVVGVRTRSRSAAAVAAPAPKRPRKQAAARAEVEEVEAGHGDDGGCYLRLRSRRLFMAAAAVEAPCAVPAEEKEAALPAAGAARSGASVEAPVVVVDAGVSRCSSTASSVDVVAAAARERSGGVTEARLREESDVGSAVSDSECGRQMREATPSSRPPADLSDEDSSQASLMANDKEHRHGSSSANVTTAAVACRARTPPEEEIEAFFAAAEKAEAERFSAKYNFDFARGLPLAGGRFEWTTVASG
ncbi:unnamed protein product [Urochloa decumbens]|uniref:Cyclin-dependent kinase inhibitor domain-containing protein n=1 Tax=Urochloa decumbens TaxID=240449 RepID=A0ABC9DX55_9POAL